MPKTFFTPIPKFYLATTNRKASQLCPISAVMHKNEVRYKIPIGEGVLERYWDKKAQRVAISKVPIPDRPEMNRLNERLEDWARLLKEIWDAYHKDAKRPLTNARFNELVRVRQGESLEKEVPTLLEFAALYVEERAKEKGAKHSTVLNLRYGQRNLAAYAEKYGSVDYDTINFDWLERFRAWLFQPVKSNNFNRKALNSNSAAQVVGSVKQFISEARKKEYTNNTLVTERGFSVKKSPTNKVSFYIQDLEKLMNCDLSLHPQKKEMERIRLLTILGVGTGLRYSDWGKVRRELVHEEGGEMMLNVFAQKTKAKIGIPFLPMLRHLLDSNDWKIPRMAVQRFNEGIKILCKYAGIDRRVLIIESVGGKAASKEVPFYEVVSSHACRRTFISTMLLLGVPASQILPVTGHATEKQMRDYAQIEGRQNAAAISKQFREGMKNFLGIGEKSVVKVGENV